MSRARGVATVELLGGVFRLRAGLGAIDAIESRLNRGFLGALAELDDESKLRIGTVLVMFEEMARSGGTPLGPEERDRLTLEDMRPMSEGIMEATTTSAGKEGGKKKGMPTPETDGSPGGPGSESPSGT